MTETLAQRKELSSDEPDRVEGYKSLSGWSVLALVLGLLSAFTLIAWGFILVCVCGVLVAWIAWIKIRRRPDELRGLGLAMIGLALSTFFGAYYASRSTSRDQWLVSQGRQFADEWIEMVRRGELQKAHQLHRDRENRKHPLAEFDPYYDDPRLKEDFDRFYRAEPLSRIVDVGRDGEVEFVEPYSILRDKEWWVVPLRYRLTYTRGGRQRTIHFIVTLGRIINPRTGAAQWKVYAVAPVEDPDSR